MKDRELEIRKFVNKRIRTIKLIMKATDRKLEIRKFLNNENHGGKSTLLIRGFLKQVTIEISDCHREIELYCDINNKENYENSVFKLETLISCLTKTLEYINENKPQKKLTQKKLIS